MQPVAQVQSAIAVATPQSGEDLVLKLAEAKASLADNEFKVGQGRRRRDAALRGHRCRCRNPGRWGRSEITGSSVAQAEGDSVVVELPRVRNPHKTGERAAAGQGAAVAETMGASIAGGTPIVKRA